MSVLSLSFAVAIMNFSLQAAEVNTKPQTKLTQADAEKVALQQVPGGKVKSAKLEKSHGEFIYLVDIASPKSTKMEEFRVDATTGKTTPVIAHVKEHTLKKATKPAAVTTMEKKEAAPKAPEKSEPAAPEKPSSTPSTSGSSASTTETK